MESFYPAIWNVLHDGVIVAIEGTVPGTISLDVSIDYLRKRFAEPGRSVRVVLFDCARCAYRESDAATFTTDLSLIALQAPEILSATLSNGVCEIECAGGVLEVVSSDGAVRLDSGREVALQELIDVADSYWKEWSERAAKARQK